MPGMERFQWPTIEEAQAAEIDLGERVAVDDELADIVIFSLSLSNALDLGVSSAVLRTLAPARSAGELQTNEHHHPATLPSLRTGDEFRGRFPWSERERAEGDGQC